MYAPLPLICSLLVLRFSPEILTSPSPTVIALTDGSTFTLRTTSPAPIFRATKDTRNHALWNPSLSSLRNQEQDEAGRLRAFREKFGRGWDIDAEDVEGGVEALEEGGVREDSLMDLISGAAGVEVGSAGASEAGSGSEGKSGKKGDVVVEDEKKGPGKRADKGWGSK